MDGRLITGCLQSAITMYELEMTTVGPQAAQQGQAAQQQNQAPPNPVQQLQQAINNADAAQAGAEQALEAAEVVAASLLAANT